MSVAEMGRLLPAEQAMAFSVEYASVMLFGRARAVTDPVSARRALQRLLNKYFGHLQPGRDYHPITDAELALTSVFQVEIAAWSGKQKRAPADFPGAFDYPPPGPGRAGRA
ncbi:MAG: pyridoxamine 5'-phosphate oxidase family protein [Planctomycetota bacterium]